MLQYFRMIGFLKPADSSPVRVWACVGASASGPTRTRNTPSLGAGGKHHVESFFAECFGDNFSVWPRRRHHLPILAVRRLACSGRMDRRGWGWRR